MSSVLRLGSSKMASCSGPSRELRLKFKWCKWDKYLISIGIRPERFRPERSKAVTWLVRRSHLTPDHEHHVGCKPGLEKAVVGSQSLRVLRVSRREDFIERRERSWRGGVESAAAVVEERSRENVTWRKKDDKRFMV